MELGDLEIYRMSRKIATLVWRVYDNMDFSTKKIIGDQWIRSVDSIGANIAEGFGRFHYADRNRFSYNARGSLHEAVHWTDLLRERSLLSDEAHIQLIADFGDLGRSLNSYITATKARTLR